MYSIPISVPHTEELLNVEIVESIDCLSSQFALMDVYSYLPKEDTSLSLRILIIIIEKCTRLPPKRGHLLV